MFDANAGRQVSTQKIDQLTNRFAAEFEDRMKDLSMSEQEALVEKLVEVMSGLDTARSFATNSAGQPAAALGSGSSTGTPTPNDLQEALNVIMAAPAATDGQKAAMTRIFFPGPDHINVESDGTPSELVSTRTQRENERTAKETAVQQLADERDPNKNGSLAKQLADAQATPANVVAKATVLPLVEAVEQAASQLDTHLMSSHIDGIDDLDAAVVAAKNAVS